MYDAIDVTGTQVGSRQGCFGSIDPAIGVYILARYIPSRPRQLCIINSALEPAVTTRSSPAKRTINATGTPITRYLFPQSWRNTCSIPDWKDSFSTLQPLTENTTQLGGSIAGRSSSLIFECQTIFQRVAFMVDRIADWKLTPRLKLIVFFFTLIR